MENEMTWTIRKQDTITRNFGVYWGATLVEGGFSGRGEAGDWCDWFQENYPNGPESPRVVPMWMLTP
jgi:hypothetical protein